MDLYVLVLPENQWYERRLGMGPDGREPEGAQRIYTGRDSPLKQQGLTSAAGLGDVSARTLRHLHRGVDLQERNIS